MAHRYSIRRVDGVCWKHTRRGIKQKPLPRASPAVRVSVLRLLLLLGKVLAPALRRDGANRRQRALLRKGEPQTRVTQGADSRQLREAHRGRADPAWLLRLTAVDSVSSCEGRGYCASCQRQPYTNSPTATLEAAAEAARAGPCPRASRRAETEATAAEMTKMAANAAAVLRRQPRGSAYHPPLGAQTVRVSKCAWPPPWPASWWPPIGQAATSRLLPGQRGRLCRLRARGRPSRTPREAHTTFPYNPCVAPRDSRVGHRAYAL